MSTICQPQKVTWTLTDKTLVTSVIYTSVPHPHETVDMATLYKQYDMDIHDLLSEDTIYFPFWEHQWLSVEVIMYWPATYWLISFSFYSEDTIDLSFDSHH